MQPWILLGTLRVLSRHMERQKKNPRFTTQRGSKESTCVSRNLINIQFTQQHSVNAIAGAPCLRTIKQPALRRCTLRCNHIQESQLFLQRHSAVFLGCLHACTRRCHEIWGIQAVAFLCARFNHNSAILFYSTVRPADFGPGCGQRATMRTIHRRDTDSIWEHNLRLKLHASSGWRRRLPRDA